MVLWSDQIGRVGLDIVVEEIVDLLVQIVLKLQILGV